MKTIGSRRLNAAVAAIAITLVARAGFSSGGWLPALSSAGKNSAYSDSGSLGPTTTFSTSAAIVKGKKKSVLVVEVTMTFPSYLGGATGVVAVDPPVVNGFATTVPGGITHPPIAEQSCSGACLVTGTFWVDLDAAEAAHPGMFIKQPLNVVVNATTSASVYGGMSIAVRQEKK